MRGVSLIKMLTQETWVTPENLTHLTAALVRARLTYGHEAYFNAPKLPSRDSTFRKHLERKKPAQHKRTTPLHDHTKVLWEKSSLNPEDVATAPISPIPPWELIKPRIIDTYETKETKHTNPLYLATLAKTRVHEEFGQHLQIYTDGSVKDNGEVGCALVIPNLGITKKYHLNNGIGIYTAELYAILKACETINNMPQPPRAAIILTDSKSSLQGLASGNEKQTGIPGRNILPDTSNPVQGHRPDTHVATLPHWHQRQRTGRQSSQKSHGGWHPRYITALHIGNEKQNPPDSQQHQKRHPQNALHGTRLGLHPHAKNISTPHATPEKPETTKKNQNRTPQIHLPKHHLPVWKGSHTLTYLQRLPLPQQLNYKTKRLQTKTQSGNPGLSLTTPYPRNTTNPVTD
ncbi:hypothetical protein ACOMHN_003877 [Nucella lapillus]